MPSRVRPPSAGSPAHLRGSLGPAAPRQTAIPLPRQRPPTTAPRPPPPVERRAGPVVALSRRGLPGRGQRRHGQVRLLPQARPLPFAPSEARPRPSSQEPSLIPQRGPRPRRAALCPARSTAARRNRPAALSYPEALREVRHHHAAATVPVTGEPGPGRLSSRDASEEAGAAAARRPSRWGAAPSSHTARPPHPRACAQSRRGAGGPCAGAPRRVVAARRGMRGAAARGGRWAARPARRRSAIGRRPPNAGGRGATRAAGTSTSWTPS